MDENPSNAPTAPGGHQPEEGSEHLVFYWAKRLLWCNPFYLASAGLLLFGISRLTVAPDFPNEQSQLFFNFDSLEAYEALLVLTAIALARRRVWYDATLLVFLENMFALVPFILVSQAAFLGNKETWLICGSGAALAAGRFWSLKQFSPRLRLPDRLLLLGTVFLAVNIAMPIIFKQSHVARDGSAADLSFHAWMWLMPFLMALGNLLPRPRHWAGDEHERSWLPLGALGIWVGVSCFHLWRLGYIYDLLWSPSLAAPVVWALAWTLCNRLSDFHPDPHPGLQKVALCLPSAVTALALARPDSNIFFALSALNTLMFGAVCLRKPENRLAFQLTMLSFTALVAGLPEAVGKATLPKLDRFEWVVLAVCANLIARAIGSRIPIRGVLGAIACGAATAILWQHSPVVWWVAVQNGLVFLLLHSLRWQDEVHDGARLIRVCAALFWIVDSVGWVHEAWPRLLTQSSLLSPQSFFGGGLSVMTYALVVLIGYGMGWAFTGRAGPKIIPISATIVLATAPGRWLWDLLREASIGLLALIGSLLLFGAGTILAWTKERWRPTERRTATE